MKLISSGAEALVSWGCAAALDDKLRPGDVVVAARVVHADGRESGSNAAWRERLVAAVSATVCVHECVLAETEHLLISPEQKKFLADRTCAIAADMESAAVARLADERRLPFLSVRAIADDAAMAIPPAIAALYGDGADPSFGALSARAVLMPQEWPALARLGLAFAAALRSLKRIAVLTQGRLAA